jgi:microcystin-dependent protein
MPVALVVAVWGCTDRPANAGPEGPPGPPGPVGPPGAAAPGGNNLVHWSSDPTQWTLISGEQGLVTNETSESLDGDSSFQFTIPTGVTGAQYTYGDVIAVDTRRTYAGAISAKLVNGTGTFSAGVFAYDAAKAPLDYRPFMVSGVTLGAAWTEFTGRITGEGTGAGTFPAGTRFIKPAIFVNEGNIGTTRVDALSIVSAASRATVDNEMAAALVPAGTVIAFAGETCPTGYVRCDGRLLAAAAYPQLFNAIGNNFGSGAGQFAVPDLRGQFIRGWDSGAGRDPDRGSRAASAAGGASGDRVGSAQGQALLSHTHTAWAPFGDLDSASSQGWPKLNNHQAFRTSDRGREYALHADAISAAGGNETRPSNLYLNYCIKL